MSSASRIERMYFLYGSQTGNSEQAALDLVNQVPTRLSAEQIRKLSGNASATSVVVEPIHMQLDDFLEMEHCAWTRLIVIVVSSYGVGQAPLGCYRFRELCDEWLAQTKDGANGNSKDMLKGVHYALCGLGDSKYTTFFRNPTVIDQGLTGVGATRVGPLGKADASGRGDQLQSKVVDDWIEGIWPHLAGVLAQAPLSEERLGEMQQRTIAICRKINPDYAGPKDKSKRAMIPPILALVALLVAALAAGLYFVLPHQTK